MKDQLLDINQTWPVGRKWCQFKYSPKKIWGPSPNIGRKNIKFLITLFATSALDTAHLRHETSHPRIKMPVSIYNV